MPPPFPPLVSDARLETFLQAPSQADADRALVVLMKPADPKLELYQQLVAPLVEMS